MDRLTLIKIFLGRKQILHEGFFKKIFSKKKKDSLNKGLKKSNQEAIYKRLKGVLDVKP